MIRELKELTLPLFLLWTIVCIFFVNFVP